MKDALGSVQSVLVLGGGSDIAQRDAARAGAAARPHDRARGARPDAVASRSPTSCAPLGATTVETVRVRRARHRAARRVRRRRVRAASATSTSRCSRSACSATRRRPSATAAAAVDIAEVNYVGSVSVAVPLAQRMRDAGPRHDRRAVVGRRRAGPPSNFVYGSSKAGMDAFFQGLGDSLVGTGVNVMIVRPGFVHTKMTDGHGRGAALDHPRSGRRRDRARPRARQRDGLGAGARSAT